MPLLLPSCHSLCRPLCNFTPKKGPFFGSPKCLASKTSLSIVWSPKTPIWRRTHIAFCSQEEETVEELGLLGKPTPKSIANGSVTEVEVKPQKPDEEEALKPFLKFFTPRDSLEEFSDSEESSEENGGVEEAKKVSVEYYEPEPGDFVVGVVVSGNENKLDVNVGADLLGTMLTKEALPLYGEEMDYLLCDTDKEAEDFMVHGKMGIVRNEDALTAETVPGRPVVELGTVLFAEVLGRTLSGRPLLSTRRFFRRIAWHRVRLSSLMNLLRLKLQSGTPVASLQELRGCELFFQKLS